MISRPMSSSAREFPVVERVQRLAALHHHVVRNIDDVVDRRDADRRQAVHQPIGTGTDADAANHAGRVARAEIRAIDPHAHQIFHPRLAFRRPCRGDRQRAIPQHGNFPRDADMAEAVGPVARDLQVDRQVVADLMRFFVVQPGHHQPLFDLSRRHGEGNVLFQPVPGDDHGGNTGLRGGRKYEIRMSKSETNSKCQISNLKMPAFPPIVSGSQKKEPRKTRMTRKKKCSFFVSFVSFVVSSRASVSQVKTAPGISRRSYRTLVCRSRCAAACRRARYPARRRSR